MEEIKLISLDLDGTLLNSKKTISERNVEALQACAEKGIEIVPTTGRTVDGIPESIKQLPGVHYAITTNGAVIADLANNKILDRRMLDWRKAAELLAFVDSYPVMYDPYINGRGIAESKFFDHMNQFGIPEEIQKLVFVTRDVVPNIIEYVKEKQSPVEKINLFFKEPDLRSQIRDQLKEFTGILVTSSMPFNLEINHPDATKGNGILRLASILGLKKAQTMAFGDGENDLSMIQEAEIGVAMENGIQSLKEAADYVTLSNDEDGVAAAIEHFILGQR